ncbi:MAG: hypothetical protein ACJA1R_001503, partial [Flavobacteriales bacterium]
RDIVDAVVEGSKSTVQTLALVDPAIVVERSARVRWNFPYAPPR